MKNKVIFIIGLFLIILSLAVLALVSNPTKDGEKISFSSGDNTLVGTYYKVENSKKAILLCGGFSSDRAMLRPLANMFVSSGISTLTFDYLGHGESSSYVGFDNATNGQTLQEIKLAIAKLKELENLKAEDILLLGHSMGGRALLELCITNDEAVEYDQIILISPQINYDNNTQSSTFTGVNDSTIAPWKDMNGENLNKTKITLIGSTSDDIVSSESMQEIYTRIQDNNNVTLTMVDGVFHSYMVYSTKVAKALFDNCDCLTKTGSSMMAMYLAWFVIIIGLIMALLALEKLLPENKNQVVLSLVNFKVFIAFKLLLWLPSLLVMALIAVVSVIMPFGSPIMSIVFIGGIAGYGLISLLVYSKGRMKGVNGVLKDLKSAKLENKNIVLSLLIFFAVLAVYVISLASGLYNLFPLNYRMFWLVFASCVMSVGFFVARHEGLMLEKESAMRIFIYNTVQYVLLVLMAIAYLFMASYSGLIGLVQNLFLLYISIFAGNCIAKLTNNLYGSIAAAVLFQSSMMTATCLMVVF